MPQKPGYLQMPPMGVNVQQMQMPPMVVQPPLGSKSVWADEEWANNSGGWQGPPWAGEGSGLVPPSWAESFNKGIEAGMAPMYVRPEDRPPGGSPFEFTTPPRVFRQEDFGGPSEEELRYLNPEAYNTGPLPLYKPGDTFPPSPFQAGNVWPTEDTYANDKRAAMIERMQQQQAEREAAKSKKKGGGLLDTILGIASPIASIAGGPFGGLIAGGLSKLTAPAAGSFEDKYGYAEPELGRR